MTKEELAFLKSQVDQVVLLEVKEERPHLGQILFVFDQGATPDVFYLRVEPVAEGGYAHGYYFAKSYRVAVDVAGADGRADRCGEPAGI